MWMRHPPNRLASLSSRLMTLSEGDYQYHLTRQLQGWDKVESAVIFAGAMFVYAWAWSKNFVARYPLFSLYWLLSTQASAALPGLVALLWPELYTRFREPIIMAAKLLIAVLHPAVRLAWHAPGVPTDARAALADIGAWSWLPMHPMALAQTGTTFMLSLSVRHSLRFKSQLLCSLVVFFSLVQSEQLARRLHPNPREHLVSTGQATALQVVCGLLLPLGQHFVLDRQRRMQWAMQRVRQHEQEEQQARQRQQRQGFLVLPPIVLPPIHTG